MPLVTRFDTPGGLRDFGEESDFYQRWHDEVNAMLGADVERGSAGPEPSPIGVAVGEFYNPVSINVTPAAERHLVWMGFPRVLLTTHRDNRQAAFNLGDSRGASDTTTQEEYLEWQVTTDKVSGKIRKVTFTTETPEYWRALFGFDPKRCAQLYGKLVGATVKESDLADSGGAYNPLNVWNTTKGIVHYIVNINTLSAAIGLARGSVHHTGARHVRDNYELSSGASTSADPRVQTDINTLARKGLSITCLEPIGLYMAGWDDTGWTKPDGSPVGNYWRVVRGRVGAALRLEYEVPPDAFYIERGKKKSFLVGDIKIGERPITRGGHLAEHVTVTIGGLAGTRAA